MPVWEGAGASTPESASSIESLRMLRPGPLGRLDAEAGAGAATATLAIGLTWLMSVLGNMVRHSASVAMVRPAFVWESKFGKLDLESGAGAPQGRVVVSLASACWLS